MWGLSHLRTQYLHFHGPEHQNQEGPEMSTACLIDLSIRPCCRTAIDHVSLVRPTYGRGAGTQRETCFLETHHDECQTGDQQVQNVPAPQFKLQVLCSTVPLDRLHGTESIWGLPLQPLAEPVSRKARLPLTPEKAAVNIRKASLIISLSPYPVPVQLGLQGSKLMG